MMVFSLCICHMTYLCMMILISPGGKSHIHHIAERVQPHTAAARHASCLRILLENPLKIASVTLLSTPLTFGPYLCCFNGAQIRLDDRSFTGPALIHSSRWGRVMHGGWGGVKRGDGSIIAMLPHYQSIISMNISIYCFEV